MTVPKILWFICKGSEESSFVQATAGASCRSHFDDRSSSDDFVTASECTCTPPSRSSSFHTASEGGVASPWWEHSEDGEDAHCAVAQSTPLDSAHHQDLVDTRVPLVASPIPVPAAYLSDSAETGDEVWEIWEYRWRGFCRAAFENSPTECCCRWHIIWEGKRVTPEGCFWAQPREGVAGGCMRPPHDSR